jgi:hypothetical protein
MPTILKIGPYRFFFYAEEGSEPPHIHIEAAERRAKYWIRPVRHFRSDGFRSGELKEIERIIVENVDLLLEAWDDFFSA